MTMREKTLEDYYAVTRKAGHADELKRAQVVTIIVTGDWSRPRFAPPSRSNGSNSFRSGYYNDPAAAHREALFGDLPWDECMDRLQVYVQGLYQHEFMFPWLRPSREKYKLLCSAAVSGLSADF